MSSNCERVDAVKSRAAALRQQLDLVPQTQAKQPEVEKAKSQVQSLDAVVKKGDAKKAESALSTAATAVRQVQTDPKTKPSFQRGVDLYA